MTFISSPERNHVAERPLPPSANTIRLDDAALARLRELDPTGRAGVVKKVLQAYLGSLDTLCEQADQALVADTLDPIRHVAHTLKSSSASVGAMALSSHCAEIEHMARTGVAEGLAVRVQLMQREAHRVRLAVQAMLAA